VFEVFLVDSEGLGGVDKNQSYDMKLFALTVLLSSFLIFNQVGVIDEAAIANLSVVTQLAKNVQVARGADGGDALASHMP
jgi:Guanylate-binding protein, N-terminal domain